ncbi:YifB family Mg chelatase-like AAA ATPase [Nocardioides terrisoli]|uniref:YifB family Mg chelatase-like AAA ATPase n=1 Tax=Nocardioides terrisoli TaxID=3388267 RepID=UPI00287B8C73|nr:YifB family Mg chelatase-like AAA ATPase [Nocardioides marmorisolisilvae]
MWATTRSVTLVGAIGHVVDVQADLSMGQIRTAVVGRPDAAVNEAIDRCRAAVDNSGFHWPTSKRITILLSPADVPKRGTHLDLAIAVAVVVAADPQADQAALRDVVLVGELCLDGRLRCVPGVLPMLLAARTRGVRRVVVPEPQVAEAMLVDGLEVVGARSLAQVVALLAGEPIPDAPPVAGPTSHPLLSWRGEERMEDLDLSEVRGMPEERYAIEVAAVGGHHLMLTGPKGAGKTTIAERIPTILPDLDREESLELTAVHSLVGSLPSDAPVLTRPPFRAPHHTASRAGILGGGTGRVRPGEVSKAHLGVLFLDEFALLPSDVIEALRQPLESGEITISRGDEEATFPARGMLVLAANPCPCGEYHPHRRDSPCKCSEVKRREYRRKLSGPIADRIDIHRFVEPPEEWQANDPILLPEPSEVVRARIEQARARQRSRYAGCGWRLNGHAPGPALRREWPLDQPATALLDRAVYGGHLTRRGATRVHRVAWSVADLRGVDRPGVPELEVALRLRSSQPLDVATLRLGGAA